MSTKAELKRQNDRLRFLLNLTSRLTSNLDLREVLRAISVHIREVIQCYAVAISLPDPEGNFRVNALDFPLGKGFAKEEQVICPTENDPGKRAFETLKPVILTAADAHNFGGKAYEIVVAEGVKTLCFVPLANRGRALGVLSIACRADTSFTQEDVEFLSQLASQLAISLENTRLYRELQQREAKIRRLVDANIVGIFTWDLEGQIIDANDAFLHIVGYEREDLISGRIRWTDLTPPEWLDRDERRWVPQLKMTGRLQPFEKEYFRKDGSRVPVLIGVARFEDSGNEGVAFVLDLTERKRAEEKLRESEAKLEEAQRIAHVGWWERDFSTNHVSLSDEVYRTFGIEPVDLPEWHERWLELIHPEDRSRTAEAAAAALRGGPRYDVEYRVVRPDGAVRIVHSQGDVTWDELGRPLGQFGVLQDITELRQAEHELRASEARFRSFVDHATDAFFRHDEQLTVLDVNRQACESLGYSREELIGMHPRDFDVGLDAASLARLAERVGAGETVTFESLHRRKDGTVFPVEIRARQFQQGEHRFRLSLVRDISERKRAEEKLRASEARFRTLVDFATDAVMLHDQDHGGTVLDLNRQACEDLGYSRDELIGRTPAVFAVEFDEALMQRINEHLDAGKVITFENRHRRKDGTVFPVEVRIRTFSQDGRWLGISLARDITERKRAEEELRAAETRFRTFVDHATDALFVHDDEGTIIEVNRQACESLGYTREELIGMAPSHFDAGLDAASMRSINERLEASEVFGFETSHRRKDGTVFPVEVRVRPFWHGGHRFGLSLARDITERKRAEEERRHAEAAKFAIRLETQVRERTRIARELHDTLLQSFQGLLLKFQAVLNMLPDRPAEARQRLERALDQATEAITEARDAVQGLRSSAVQTDDLVQCIKNIGEELTADVTHPNPAAIHVEVRGAPRDLDPIVCDEVYRIGGEALRNAFRHAEAHDITVEIRYDERQFRLRVRDDGKGIDEETLRRQPPTGHFGLHGMRERAEIVGGRLEVWSKPHSGTDIDLRIPAGIAYAA